MLCTRCRMRTAVTDDGLCTFCSGTRPPLPGGLMAPVAGPGGTGGGPRSPVGLSWAVMGLLGVVVAVDLFAIAAGLHVRGQWDRLVTDSAAYVYRSAGDRADRLYSYATTAQVYALLVTGIVFIAWFRRTRRNAEVFEAGVQPMGPGWAVGGWFVPVANLWIPYRIARGIWAASAQTSPDGRWRTVSHRPLNLWWSAWAGSSLFAWFCNYRWARAREPQQIVDAATLTAVADALHIVAAVLAVVFVRSLTGMQSERAAHRLAPVPAVPGAHR